MNPTDSTATTTATANAASLPIAATLTPGWKTTEFWMTALSNAGLALAAGAGLLPPKYAAVAAAASQVAYNVSRGLAKQGQPQPAIPSAAR